MVLLLLTLTVTLVLSLSRDVHVEAAIAGQVVDEMQLRALAMSAVERALAELALDRGQPATLFSPWRNDEARFRGAVHGAGRYWFILAEPDPGDGRELHYGLQDESSKLNVNAATREQLLALPGVTEDAVDGILDWRDEDEDPLDYGAEASYYGALDPPYVPKNGPIESLDELLRVRMVDPAILYGEDRNRNGILDPGEDDGDRSFPPDDADGVLDRGLANYLTVFSRELNRTLDGRARVSWSDSTEDELTSRMQQAGLAEPALFRLQQLKGGNATVSTYGELLRFPEMDQPAAAIILDEIAVSGEEFKIGRINVNTAPREVLAGLPGLEADEVEAIMQARLTAGADLTSPAWLMGVIPPEKFQFLADLTTTRSDQFTIHVVAELDRRPGRFVRLEVLVDRGYVPPRILLWRDLTPLGFPLPGERGPDLP